MEENNIISLLAEITKENIEKHIANNDLQIWINNWTKKMTIGLNCLLVDFYEKAIDNILNETKQLLQEHNYNHFDILGVKYGKEE